MKYLNIRPETLKPLEEKMNYFKTYAVAITSWQMGPHVIKSYRNNKQSLPIAQRMGQDLC